MKNYESRLGKLERIILDPLEEIAIFINKQTGEDIDLKIKEIENNCGKKIDRKNSVFISVSGLIRI